MNTSRSVGSRGQSRDRTTGRMGQVKPIVDEGRVWKKTGPLVLAQSRAIAWTVNWLKKELRQVKFSSAQKPFKLATVKIGSFVRFLRESNNTYEEVWVLSSHGA